MPDEGAYLLRLVWLSALQMALTGNIMPKPNIRKIAPPGQYIIQNTKPNVQTMTVRAEKILTPLPIRLILGYSIAPMMATTAIRTAAQNIMTVPPGQ